ncbi:MAG: OmpA family protein [Mariprofundaceae bacterium]
MNRNLIAVLACSTLLGACATHSINIDHSELGEARQHVTAARDIGGEACAPQQMAKAQAHLLWAAHEVTEGVHPDENAELIASAIKYADEVVAACKTSMRPETIALVGVNFENNSADLTAASITILNGAVAILKKRGNIRVEVGAHTDSRGKNAYNQELSEKRAATVRDYLEMHGITADRVQSKGYGESKPIADNATAEGRAKNRRVELTVLR